MQIVIPTPSLLKRVVGKQKHIESQVYRLMAYVVQYPVENGVLLYHALTCCMVLLSFDEATHFAEIPELIDLWFLVPEQHDDYKFCQQVLKVAQLFKTSDKSISTYTILTTTGCNARCFYCYERGTKPIAMTEETAEKTVRYIQEHRGENEVKLHWFGGEPLVNAKIIDYICTRMSQENVPFKSQMISNGFLFDTEMVHRAKDLWHLKRIQITLDGIESTYNRIKNYIYGNVNAFERVLGNIERLTAASIDVQIRLNVDTHNIAEISELISFLHQRFGTQKHLSVYSRELYGKRTPEESADLYQRRILLAQQIAEFGYRRQRELPKGIKLNGCMADDDHSVVVSPGGFLGKCEHCVDRDFFGHIDCEEIDEKMMCSFKERANEIEACPTCPYYPQCIRLVKCEDGSECTPERQKENIYNTIEAMKDEYQKYLTNHAHDTEI